MRALKMNSRLNLLTCSALELNSNNQIQSYKIKNLLDLYAAKVLSTDPYVHTDPDILPLNQVIENSDVLVLCTPHSQYRDLDTAGKTVIDIWGFLNSSQT